MFRNNSKSIYVIVFTVVILCLSVVVKSVLQDGHEHEKLKVPEYDESKSVEPIGTPAFLPQRHKKSEMLDGPLTSQRLNLLVTSSSSGEPLKGVLVLVVSRDGKSLGSLTTSESGLVTLRDRGYPKLIAHLSHPTHLPVSLEVEMNGGTPVKTVAVALVLGGVIRGRIAKFDGQCLDGTVVTASLMSLGVNEKDQWTKTVRRIESIRATPNKEGYFAFGGLPFGSTFSLSFEVPKTHYVLPVSRYHVVQPNDPPIELMIASLYAFKIELIDSATRRIINLPINTKITFQDSWFHSRFVWLNPTRINSNTVDLSRMVQSGFERSWQYFVDKTGGPLESVKVTGAVEIRGYEPASIEILISPLSQVPFLSQQMELTRRPEAKLVQLRLPIGHAWPEHEDRWIRVRRIRQYNQSLEYYSMRFQSGLSEPVPLTKGDYLLEYGHWQQSKPFHFDGEADVQQIEGLSVGVDISIEQPVLKNETKAQYFVIRTVKLLSDPINKLGPLDDLPVCGAFKPVVFQSLPIGSYRMMIELPQSEKEQVYEWEITKEALKSRKFRVNEKHLQ